MPILPGDGSAWFFVSSRLSTLMFFGLDENSFILLFPSFGFCSCSGSAVTAGLGEAWGGGTSTPGECNGLLGYATFAAVVAAILPPIFPFE